MRCLDRDLLGGGIGEFSQEGIARWLGVAGHDRGIAETDVNHRRHRDALQRAVDRLHGVALGGRRILPHPGLVELDHVGAGFLQFQRLGVDGRRQRHRELFVVLVEFVFGLLAHGEGAGQRDLGGMVGVAAKEFHVPQLDRTAGG